MAHIRSDAFFFLAVFLFTTQLAFAKDILFPSKNKSPKRLIVFVHGLKGNSRETWVNGNSNFFWPEALSKQNDFKDADILSYGFDSKCKYDFTISEVSRNLADVVMEKIIERKYSSISFVAHSLGGLVVRDLVVYDRIRNAKISNLVTLATPSLGASLAKYVNYVCDSTQVSDLKDGRNSTIDKLNDSWRDKFDKQARSLSFSFIAAYEIIPTYRVSIVVDKDSAVAFSHSIKAVDKDHFEIAKPRDEQDPVFRWVNMWLNSKNTSITAVDIAPPQSVKGLQDFFEKLRTKLKERDYNAFSKAYQSGEIPTSIPKSDREKILDFKNAIQR